MAHVDRNFLKSRGWVENADGSLTNGRPFHYRETYAVRGRDGKVLVEGTRASVVPAGVTREPESAAALEANRPEAEEPKKNG